MGMQGPLTAQALVSATQAYPESYLGLLEFRGDRPTMMLLKERDLTMMSPLHSNMTTVVALSILNQNVSIGISSEHTMRSCW